MHVCIIIGYPVFIGGNDRIFLSLLENGFNLKSLYEIAKKTTIVAFSGTCPLMGIDPPNAVLDLPEWSIILIALFYEYIEILSGCIWILSNLVILMWGFVFMKLIKSFLVKSQTNRYLGGRVLEVL